MKRHTVNSLIAWLQKIPEDQRDYIYVAASYDGGCTTSLWIEESEPQVYDTYDFGENNEKQYYKEICILGD